MLFVTYRMFVIQKIAKMALHAQKQRMSDSNLSKIVTKNSTTIECLLFLISHYLLFVI